MVLNYKVIADKISLLSSVYDSSEEVSQNILNKKLICDKHAGNTWDTVIEPCKLELIPESPGGLVNTDGWAHPQSVRFSRSRVGPENSHFQQVPRFCCYSWSGHPTYKPL